MIASLFTHSYESPKQHLLNMLWIVEWVWVDEDLGWKNSLSSLMNAGPLCCLRRSVVIWTNISGRISKIVGMGWAQWPGPFFKKVGLVKIEFFNSRKRGNFMSLILVRHYFFVRTFRPPPVKPICFNKDNDLDIVDLLIRINFTGFIVRCYSGH